jgi:hypothetical protein
MSAAMKQSLLALVVTASLANGEVLVLTEDNFKAKTAGKLVSTRNFIVMKISTPNDVSV